MQIEGIQQNTTSTVQVKTDKKEPSIEGEKTFHNLLEQQEAVIEEKQTSPLKEMVQSIDQLKRMLDYELTVENLAKYKESVQEFLTYYTNNELKMEDHFVKDHKGYEQKVSIIRSVDEKLNDLNENMLESPLGHIETLRKIGEINGLVVNLLL